MAMLIVRKGNSNASDKEKKSTSSTSQTQTITTTYGSSSQENKSTSSTDKTTSSTDSNNQESTNSNENASDNNSNGSINQLTGNQGTSGYQNANLSNLQNNGGNNINSVVTQDPDPEPSERKVYGTVKATVHVFNKSLTSRGILDFKIIDAHNQRVLTQEKMPGEFIWYTEWGYFNGDERALDDYFLEVVKSKEAYPPPPQDLFVAFTQPIFGQVTGKIRDFYRNY